MSVLEHMPTPFFCPANVERDHTFELGRISQAEQVLRVAAAHRLDGGQLLAALTANDVGSSRLALFINIVTRLEVRLRHDPKLVRAWLTSPQPSLNHRVPLEMVGEVDALRIMRGIVGSLVIERPRMWRVAHAL